MTGSERRGGGEGGGYGSYLQGFVSTRRGLVSSPAALSLDGDPTSVFGITRWYGVHIELNVNTNVQARAS